MKSLLITAVTFCGILFGLATTPAKAVTLDVICPGTQTSTYSPGVLITPQSVTLSIKQIFGPCISSDPTLISGKVTRTEQITTSCLRLAGANSGIRTIVWNNGKTSAFAYNSTPSNILGETVVVSTGIIEAGEFAGDTAVLTVTQENTNVLACLGPPGVTSIFGVVTLSIVKP